MPQETVTPFCGSVNMLQELETSPWSIVKHW